MNRTLVTNYNVQPWIFQIWLFDLTDFIVWNRKGLRHQIAKLLGLENQIDIATNSGFFNPISLQTDILVNHWKFKVYTFRFKDVEIWNFDKKE